MSSISSHICVYNNCFKRRYLYKDITFFSFPVKDSKRTEEWKKNCGNTNIALMDVGDLKNKLICEKHFMPKDIIIGSKRKLLSKNAIPIEFIEKDKKQVPCNASDNLELVDAKSPSNESFITPLASENKINFEASTSDSHVPIKTYTRKRPSSTSGDYLIDDLKSFLVLKQLPEISQFTSTDSSESKLSDQIVAMESPTKNILKKKCKILSCKIKLLKNKLKARQSQTYRLKKKQASFSTADVLNNLLLGRSKQVKVFINMQLFHRKGIKWTKAQKQLALSLHHKSPSAYKFMLYNLKFTLPPIRTIQSWLKVGNLRPGFEINLTEKLSLKAKTMIKRKNVCSAFGWGYFKETVTI